MFLLSAPRPHSAIRSFWKGNLRGIEERKREKHIAVAELSGKFISFLMRLQGKWKMEAVHHVSAARSLLRESLCTLIFFIILPPSSRCHCAKRLRSWALVLILRVNDTHFTKQNTHCIPRDLSINSSWTLIELLESRQAPINAHINKRKDSLGSVQLIWESIYSTHSMRSQQSSYASLTPPSWFRRLMAPWCIVTPR